MGPQGSGKGTQADLLSKRFSVPHVDAGQLLREEVAKGTAIGKRVEHALKTGVMVPHDAPDELIKERLSQPDCAKGFVLDGYPRQLPQAEFLDEIADLDAVIVLDISDALAVERLSARRVCEGCTVPIYGLFKDIKQQCGECGGKLVQREDDKPAPIKKRLKAYHEITEPLVEYYKPRDIVRRIDADGTVEEVFKRIMAALS